MIGSVFGIGARGGMTIGLVLYPAAYDIGMPGRCGGITIGEVAKASVETISNKNTATVGFITSSGLQFVLDTFCERSPFHASLSPQSGRVLVTRNDLSQNLFYFSQGALAPGCCAPGCHPAAGGAE